jgi:hypothetical protein
MPTPYEIRPIGYVEPPLVDRETAPKQGFEGAPDAWLVFNPDVAEGTRDLAVGERACDTGGGFGLRNATPVPLRLVLQFPRSQVHRSPAPSASLIPQLLYSLGRHRGGWSQLRGPAPCSSASQCGP